MSRKYSLSREEEEVEEEYRLDEKILLSIRTLKNYNEKSYGKKLTRFISRDVSTFEAGV